MLDSYINHKFIDIEQKRKTISVHSRFFFISEFILVLLSIILISYGIYELNPIVSCVGLILLVIASIYAAMLIIKLLLEILSMQILNFRVDNHLKHQSMEDIKATISLNGDDKTES